MVEPGVKIQTA